MSVEEIKDRIKEAQNAVQKCPSMDRWEEYARSLEILLNDIMISLKPWDK